jgi:NSS family neurotransmitter:Na+ symporter
VNEAKQRERWSSRPAFIMAAIGSAIGLGNVWRFPAICYAYGGGTFLIPWLIGLVVLGLPWFLVELGMGNRMQSGAPGSFAKIGKKWEWAGWWPIFVSFFLNCYYVIIMAWAVCYIGFSTFLGWEKGVGPLAERVPSFFYNDFLRVTSGPGVLGGLNLVVVGALALCWIAIFLILYKGVRRVGKVVIYTVSIPWACLLILVLRGLTLPGAIEGLNAYLTPDLSALGDMSIWVAAFGQVAFTLSLGMGIMFAYGSYLPKKSDVSNNAMITSFANCATSFFAGFAIFSTLGYMAQSLGISIAEIPNVGGLGLAFQTYPTAISLMPFAQRVIGLIFFLCLLTLGIDSAFSISEAMITAIVDKWKVSKTKATATVCLSGFLIGFIFATGAGLYWLDMIDRAVAFFGLILTGTAALLIVGWVYGAEKLREHLNSVSEIKVGRWFDWLVKVVAPVLALFAIIPQFIAEIAGKELLGIKITENVLEYPLWAELIGFWGFIVMPIALALIFGFVLKEKK